MSQTLDTGNNNVAETTENVNGLSYDTIVTGNRDSANRSHELLVINNSSSPNVRDQIPILLRRRKLFFKEFPNTHLSM